MIITNKYNLPAPYLKACQSNYQYKDKRYSVTSILCSPRETILKRRHHDEIIQDCSDMHWLIFGTAVHKVLEDYDGGITTMAERGLEYHTSNGYTLSGRLDLYDIEKQKVSDWKTASVWKWVSKDFDDYKHQLKQYAVMLNINGLPCHSGEIVFMFKDYSEMKKMQDLDGSYPERPTISKGFEFTQEELQEEVDFIENYFSDIELLEKVRDDELPLCSYKDRTFNGVDTYAIMKKGNKRAVKLCHSAEEAEKELALKDDKHYIEFRKAEDKKCKQYCQSAPFCNYYKDNYAEYFVKDKDENVVASFSDYDKAREFIKYITSYGELHIERVEE